MSHKKNKKKVGSALEYSPEVNSHTNKSKEFFECAVPSCRNRLQASTNSSNPYEFYNFPKNLCYRTRWKRECGLDPSANVSLLKVCSEHFDSNDYIQIKQEDSSYVTKLRFNACPRKNLGNKVEDNAQRTHMELKGKYKKLLKEQYDLEQQILNYGKKSRSVQAEITMLVHHNLEEEKNTDVDYLSKIFSPAQIDILSGEEKVYWTDDDMARAFTIRHMSSKDCYMYLKKNLNIPLPSLASVQKWAASGNKKT